MKELSNKEKLENYLLLNKEKKPFLLDDNNNGKTIMLSGAWGAGKTYFWREEIEPELSKKLKAKKKACVYVSLYGKDSLDTLKKEIYIKASSAKELLSKEVSTFGFDALSSIKDSDLKIGQLVKAGANLYNKHKSDKGIERLKDGGLICLDDFERKSKQIDLNDLFGFISQLAIEMNCKIVIILNDDVFVGKEAEVFRNVKEKTVNKFFYFKPTPKELFDSIANNVRYDDLNDYKEDILKAIEETEELNARIYIQVLDNCLEWLRVKENLDEQIIRVLVLGTFNFVLNHMVLDYAIIQIIKIEGSSFEAEKLDYKLIDFYSEQFDFYLQKTINNDLGTYVNHNKEISEKDFFKNLKRTVITPNYGKALSEKDQEEHLLWLKENKQELKALWKYGYRLYYVADVEEKTYNEIAQFIESGILI